MIPTPRNNRKLISEFCKKTYHDYVCIKLGDQDKLWTPHIVCRICLEHIRQWTSRKQKLLKFAIPLIWLEPQNHYDGC